MVKSRPGHGDEAQDELDQSTDGVTPEELEGEKTERARKTGDNEAGRIETNLGMSPEEAASKIESQASETEESETIDEIEIRADPRELRFPEKETELFADISRAAVDDDLLEVESGRIEASTEATELGLVYQVDGDLEASKALNYLQDCYEGRSDGPESKLSRHSSGSSLDEVLDEVVNGKSDNLDVFYHLGNDESLQELDEFYDIEARGLIHSLTEHGLIEIDYDGGEIEYSMTERGKALKKTVRETYRHTEEFAKRQAKECDKIMEGLESDYQTPYVFDGIHAHEELVGTMMEYDASELP